MYAAPQRLGAPVNRFGAGHISHSVNEILNPQAVGALCSQVGSQEPDLN
jgi:hypothetical protein